MMPSSRARAGLALGEALQQAAQGRDVGVDARRHELRVVPDQGRGQQGQGRRRRDAEDHHDLGPCRLERGHLVGQRPRQGAGVVVLLRHHVAGGDLLVQPGRAVLADVVVLQQVADLLAGEVGVDVADRGCGPRWRSWAGSRRCRGTWRAGSSRCSRRPRRRRGPSRCSGRDRPADGSACRARSGWRRRCPEGPACARPSPSGRVVAVVLVGVVDLAAVDAALGS